MHFLLLNSMIVVLSRISINVQKWFRLQLWQTYLDKYLWIRHFI